MKLNVTAAQIRARGQAARRLDFIRHESELTIKQLAVAFEAPQATASAWTRGFATIPPSYMALIENAFDEYKRTFFNNENGNVKIIDILNIHIAAVKI